MIRRMIGTSEHSVSIIEFDLGMIELHAKNCSIAHIRTILEHNPPRPRLTVYVASESLCLVAVMFSLLLPLLLVIRGGYSINRTSKS